MSRTADINMITPFSGLRNIVSGMDFTEYRKLDALNAHSLFDFIRNPLRWHEGWFERNRKETPAMKLGTQAHELILQGEDFFHQNNALLEPPVNPKTGEPYGASTKAYAEFLAEWTAENQGKRSYTPQDWETLQTMAAECYRDPAFVRILRPVCDDTHSEVMFLGDLVPGLTVKGSIDRYDDCVGIVDLKTTSSITKNFWKYTIFDFNYVEQLAFYQIALKDVCGGEIPPAFIAAVETGGEFRSEVRLADERVMQQARSYVYHCIGKYMDAVSGGIFPGPSDELGVIEYYPRSQELQEALCQTA